MFAVMGYLRLFKDKFKFTGFDTLLAPDAELEENYGLSNVLNVDLFALIYTAIYIINLCNHSGVPITKELFLPVLKNSSLFIVRYMRGLCATELKRFSVHYFNPRGSSVGSKRQFGLRLKGTFNLLQSAFLFLNKPLGFSNLYYGNSSSQRSLPFEENDISDMTSSSLVSNFARRMGTSLARVQSTPVDSEDGNDDSLTSISNESNHKRSRELLPPVATYTRQSVPPPPSSSSNARNLVPQSSDLVFSGTYIDEEEEMPSPVTRSTRPKRNDVSSDKYLKYLAESFLGPHVGGGITNILHLS